MKTVIVTGAFGNLGKAVVKKLLTDQYKVIAIASPGSNSGTSQENLVVMESDLSIEAASQKLIDSIVAQHQTIDAVIMLAGGYEGGGIGQTEGSTLHKMFSLNFETAYFIARPVFAQMSKQSGGGKIIFTGARPALKPEDGRKSLGYALSKSLLFKLADFLNADGAASNIHSSVIVPSTIDTPANRSAMPQADFSAWVKPEEIADVISFILSGKSSALRETVLKVYGRA